MLVLGGALLMLLAASYLLLLFASRSNASYSYSLDYAPRASVVLLIGPQSLCPPLVLCPQFTHNPKAISIWLRERVKDDAPVPIWQTDSNLRQRRILYIATP